MNNTNTNTNNHKDPIPWPQPNHSKNTLPKTDGCNRSTCRNECDDKAKNMNDAKMIFDKSLGNPGYANGTISNAILVQECVEGKEYVVADGDVMHFRFNV
jgi:hypothetical protein